MKNKIISLLILMIPFLDGCSSSEKKMKEFFKKNRESINKLKVLSKEFHAKYKFEYASFRNHTKDIGLKFSVHDRDPYKGTGEYFNAETLEPMIHNNGPVCDSCSAEERQRYECLLNDTLLKKILQEFLKIEPQAILITSGGIFFALGKPIKSKNTSEVEGGIFIPFYEEFNKTNCFEEISKDVYLCDEVIN